MKLPMRPDAPFAYGQRILHNTRPAASSLSASLPFASRTASLRPRLPSKTTLSHHGYEGARSISSTPCLFKKRKPDTNNNSSPSKSSHPASKTSSSPSSPSSSSSSSTQPNPDEPLDFSSVTTAYAASDAHFRPILQSVLHGGRFNPDSLGALPVTVKDDSSSAPSTFPLHELAQVVPRTGRTISLLANDRAFIKPIMSAVQASREFNQQPQRAEDNELELLLRVEPERRDELTRRIRDAAKDWRDRVRQARSRYDKALKDWKKSGAVLPDVVRRAEKDLQKLQDKKMRDIDQEEAQTVKQLDRGS